MLPNAYNGGVKFLATLTRSASPSPQTLEQVLRLNSYPAGTRPLIALARALHVIVPVASTVTCPRARDRRSSISRADMPAIVARTFVPKVLVDQKSSKFRNVLHTVISLRSISSSPTSVQRVSSASISEAAALGGSGGGRPV